jgi:hypothetical protein
MSARPPLSDRLSRLVEIGPVLAALAVHASGHARWPLALPVAAALLVFVNRGWMPRFTEKRFAVAGAIGAAVGLALLPLAPPPSGPIPGILLSPICGLLLATAFWCAATRKALYAWLYAWLLAILSAGGEPGLGLYAALVALGASTLAASYGQGKLGRAGLPGAIAVCLCAVSIAAASVAGAEGIKASEGFLVEHVGGAIYDWMNKSGLRPRLGLQEIVSTPRRSTGQQSSRALFEIEGARELSRLRTVVLDHYDGDSWSTSGTLGERQLVLPGASPSARRIELLFLEPLGGRIPSPAGTAALSGARAEVRGGWVLLSNELEGRKVELGIEPGERLPPEPAPGPELLELPE